MVRYASVRVSGGRASSTEYHTRHLACLHAGRTGGFVHRVTYANRGLVMRVERVSCSHYGFEGLKRRRRYSRRRR